MKKLLTTGLFAVSVVASSAHAAPISIGGPLSGTGDGLNASWADVSYGIGNIATAKNAISTSTDVTNIVNYIDFSQNGYGGLVTGYDPTPAGIGNETWAVEMTGFLNVATSGTYDFNIFTDDGFELVIGGELISQFNGNRAPSSSTANDIFLDAGLYDFSFIHWENGGVQAAEVTWRNSDTSPWALISDEFYTSAAEVPAPAPLALLGMGLFALGFARKR